MKYLGLDFGGTEIKVGEVTPEGKITNKFKFETPDDVIDAVAQEIKARYDLSEIGGIGFTVPGPINGEGYLSFCSNIKKLRDCYPARMLSEKLGGVKCIAGNDGKLAALGEYEFGSGKKYNSIMMATIGTAIGGGLIIDGKVIYGANAIAAEISHIHVKDDEPIACGCGGHGCLEQYASGRGLSRRAKECGYDGDMLIPKNIIDAAKAGDKKAYEIVDWCFAHLGKAFATVSCLVDPEAFIIGGGVGQAGQFLIDIIYKYYDEMLTITKGRADIVQAQLGNDAGILGAAKLAMDLEN